MRSKFLETSKMTLSDVCLDVSYGYTESANIIPVGPKFLRITDIQGGKIEWNDVPFCTISDNDFKKYALHEGDIVVARTGNSTGENSQILKVPPAAVFASYLIRFRVNPQLINPYFVGYQLRSSRFRDYILSVRSGSAQPGANAKQIGLFPIQIIATHLQNEAVTFLQSLDKKIALLQETNKTLESIAKTLFKDWFVDFGPVKAKMAGKKPYLDQETWDLFPDKLDSEGKPEGWEISTVADSFILTMGQSPPGDTYNSMGNGLPFYQGRTDFGFRFPQQRIFCSSPTRLAKLGDTLVSVRAPVGDVNVAIEDCCLGRGVASLRHPKGYQSFTLYVAQFLREKLNLFDQEGTVFGAINKKDFESLTVIKPPQKALEAFHDIVASIDHRIMRNEWSIRALSDMRDTLLPKLISGEIRLQDTKSILQRGE